MHQAATLLWAVLLKPQLKTDWIGVAGLIGCVVCWGITPVILRGLTDDIDAWVANGVRYPLAALLYWPVLASFRRRGAVNADLLKRSLVPAFFSLSGQVFWGLAFYYLSASAVGFFVRGSIAWTMIAGMVVFAEERTLLKSRRFFVGLIVCAAGFLVLSFARGTQSMKITTTGVILILICGLLFGLYSVSIRYFLKPIPSPLAAATVCQYVALGTFLLMPLGEPAILASLPVQTWLLIALSSLLGIVIGHTCLYMAVNRLGTSISSGGQSVTPFITAGGAFAFLDEALSLPQWLGGVAIVAGVVVLLTTRRG